jgi:hypothetical protein
LVKLKTAVACGCVLQVVAVWDIPLDLAATFLVLEGSHEKAQA